MTSVGQAPNYAELFLRAHSVPGTDKDPTRVAISIVQERVNEMREMLNRNQEISSFELTKTVFGRQGYGRVIGMGTGVRPTNFKEDYRGVSQVQHSEASRQHNEA